MTRIKCQQFNREQSERERGKLGVTLEEQRAEWNGASLAKGKPKAELFNLTDRARYGPRRGESDEAMLFRVLGGLCSFVDGVQVF